MTTMMELPAVARSFALFCKKCNEERLHKVLAHVGDKAAKVECEICKKKSTFKLGATKEAKKKKATATRTSKARGSAASRGPSWDEMQEKFSGKAPKRYNIADRFEKDGVLEHPKFGVGYILSTSDSRIDAVFQEGLKTLVHNHKS